MKLGQTNPELLEASSLYKKIYNKAYEEGKKSRQVTFGFADKDFDSIDAASTTLFLS